MVKIHTLKISNFRSIQTFEQVFGMTDFACIIGRGDSGKTTILDSISLVLSPSWNLSFFDTDFYDCNIKKNIEIEVTLYDLPEKLLREDKYGFFINGLNKETNVISDNLNENDEPALSIKLLVKSDLEPKWFVFSNREGNEPIEIKASDRAILNMFFISDYIDKHFSWNVGTPLYSLLKQGSNEDSASNNVLIDAFRGAKSEIDLQSFEHLNQVITKVKATASSYAVDISNATTTIDFRDLYIKDGRVCLHEDKIPFRLKGKGSKRLISVAIQTELVKLGGIILIDEVEQGLEPDRIQHLVQTLKKNNHGQIFITTHSRNVLVELSANNIFLMKKNNNSLIKLNNDLQGCIRRNPDAFFSKKVLICEGATEFGICLSLNEYRINQQHNSASINGVVFVNGTGATQIQYAKDFNKANYDVCLFCDSDVQDINQQKESMRSLGIKIVDCDDNSCIESQIFKDLPWDGIKELISYKVDEKGEDSLLSSINSKSTQKLNPNWKDKDDIDIRNSLFEASIVKKNEWFKSIEHGKFLGEVICKYLSQMINKKLKNQIEELCLWIDQ